MIRNPNIKHHFQTIERGIMFVRFLLRVKFLLLLILLSHPGFPQADSIQDTNFQTATAQTDSLQTELLYKIGLPHIPGLMFRDEVGNINGFALEIFEAIAKDENIPFVWIDGSWSELFNKLQKGEIDALTGTQESEAQKEFLDFTNNSLYAIWSELYINEQTIFEHISQLQGQKIGLVIGDNNAVGFLNYIAGFNIEIAPVFFNNHLEAMKMLSAQQIYGMAGPTPNILTDLPANIKNSGLYFNSSELKISFKKDTNQELKDAIDNRLDIYKKDKKSIYYQLFEKYNLSDIKETSWEMPEWLKIVLLLIFVALLIAILFVFTLKKQVNIRTKELADRQIYLTKSMETGEMGTWSFDLKSKDLYLSDEFYIVTGIEKEKNWLSLDDLRRFVHPDDVEKLINNFHLIETRKGKNNYCRLINKDGETVYVKIIGLIQRNNLDFPTNTIGLIQNITAQLKHETELVQAKDKAEESEKLKSSFLENMSHEIRTPLNSIIGFSDMLAKENLPHEKRVEFKYIILQQNELLLSLINDILDFSRIEAGSLEIEMSEVYVSEIINEVYDHFIQECPEEIEYKKVILIPDINQCIIFTDESRIRQILSNMVSNAFKYTTQGTIEFGCRPSEKEGYFDFFVKDTGVGILPEQQNLIFDRFSQLDGLKQGSGLGLAISQSLALMLGSEIKLFSEYGKGSEFFMTFPLNKTEKVQTQNLEVENS